jgi:hypothetical protein
MGEKNPQPVIEWPKQYLHHPEREIRKKICDGTELRGRTHPQDILPLLAIEEIIDRTTDTGIFLIILKMRQEFIDPYNKQTSI